MSEQKSKIGRPTDFREDLCELLVDHMAAGFSFESFAGRPDVGTHKGVLYEWVARHPSFTDAKRRGEEAGRMWWERQAVECARNRSEGGKAESLNTSLWRLVMMNRFGLHDAAKINVELTNPDVARSVQAALDTGLRGGSGGAGLGDDEA